MAISAPAAEHAAPTAALRGVLLVVAAAALFGTIGTARVLGPEASSWSVGALRLLLAAVALVALAAWRDGWRPTWRLTLRPESLLAGGGQAAFQLTFLTAVELTGVAVTTLVAIGSAPLLTGLVTRSVTRAWVVATAIALTGLALLVAGGSVDPLDPTGLVLAVGAGAAYAGYTVASSRLAADAPPSSVTAAGFVVAAALLAPALAFTDNRWAVTGEGLALVLYLALAATALAYLLFVTGLRAVPPATAQTMGLAEPVVATVLGIAVLDERLRPVGLIGIALVLAALVLLARARLRSAS